MKNYLINLANELISISLPMQAIRSQLSLFKIIVWLSLTCVNIPWSRQEILFNVTLYVATIHLDLGPWGSYILWTFIVFDQT